MIKELKEVLKKEAEEKGNVVRVTSIEKSTTLSHLGYTFKEAIKKLKEAGVTIILTEEEKERRIEEIREAIKTIEDHFDVLTRDENGLTNGKVNMRKFESTSDIIMIHKTDYAPKNDRIESRYSGGILDDCCVTLGGEKYDFTCKSGRNTVHFAANHEVSAHSGGSWSKMKYAVIIPFDDLKRCSTIGSAKSVDTYTRGAAKLTENSYILCPKGEGSVIQKENPTVTVIEYEGEVVKNYANILISELGYKLEFGNEHGFDDTEQANIYCDIMTKEGFTVQKHFFSEDKKKERILGTIYEVVALMKLISDKQLIENLDREELIDDLTSQRVDELISIVFSSSNKPYYDVFEEELKKIGINISIEDWKNALESHITNDMLYKTIMLEYMLDAIEESNKKKLTANDIAEADKQQALTTTEVGEIKGLINEIEESFKGKGEK